MERERQREREWKRGRERNGVLKKQTNTHAFLARIITKAATAQPVSFSNSTWKGIPASWILCELKIDDRHKNSLSSSVTSWIDFGATVQITWQFKCPQMVVLQHFVALFLKRHLSVSFLELSKMVISLNLSKEREGFLAQLLLFSFHSLLVMYVLNWKLEWIRIKSWRG